MFKKFFLFVVLFSCSLTVFNLNAEQKKSIFDTSSSSLFSNEDDFLKPEQAFIFNFDQQGRSLKVSFDIAEGYYLYKKQFKFIAEQAEIATVSLPRGIDHEDEFFGKQQIYLNYLEFVIPLKSVNEGATINIRYQGCAKAGLCFPPIIKTVQLSQLNSDNNFATANNVLASLNSAVSTDNTTATPTENQSEQYQLANMLKGDNLPLTLLAFFIGGLLLAFTPCVFPMYPILTGIIVGQKDNLATSKAFSLSFVYVQGMAITYTALGVVVALAGAQFQAMFQHPALLISLSVLFIFLSLSMFGFYHLALPSSWQNKLNNVSNSQKGGSYLGVLTMGAISGLVASPCTTAPLTGALLYISQSGDIALGASALYALSIGMGLPLLVLGSSGGKLLPKAGAWMDVIKNTFGLLLLAVPIFLLERFLPTTISIILWLALILASSHYFISINMTSQTSALKHLRTLLIGAISIGSILFITNGLEQDENGFLYVNDLAELNQAVINANQQGKTVMVDLYADWCIACKEFEHKTFPMPNVQQALANSVLIQIDLTDTASPSSKELMKHYEIFGLPSILFFDLNGQELTKQRVTGFMSADEFAKHINKIFNQK